MLSLIGWTRGLSSLLYLVVSCIIGVYFIYLSRKTNAKLLSYFGLYVIFMGLWGLLTTIDFLSVLFTGDNYTIYLPMIYHFFLSWMWPYLSGLVSLFIIFELLKPEMKWYLMTIYSIFIIIVFYFLIIDPYANIQYIFTNKPNEDLVEGIVVFGSPAFILSSFLLISGIFLGGFGIYYKSIQSSGILKKKLRYFSVGYTVNFLFLAFSTLIPLGIIFFVYRIGMLCTYWFFYVALREEQIEPKKILPKKEIKVEQSLFRLSKRPDYISDEEITYYKEQEICLVCKGKVDRHSYICPKCRALYCEKCALALINLENACWVCNTAIDESKPVKLYKKMEVEDLEVLKESKIKDIEDKKL